MKLSEAIADNRKVVLWRHNKVNEEYTVTRDKLRQDFLAWCRTKDVAWLEYYGTRTALCTYISIALDSVTDLLIYDTLAEDWRREFWDLILTQNG
jgi:hypothetical protein